MQSLAAANRCGAFTLLMTAHVKPEFRKYCKEILLFSVREYVENSKVISPQFPYSGDGECFVFRTDVAGWIATGIIA